MRPSRYLPNEHHGLHLEHPQKPWTLVNSWDRIARSRLGIAFFDFRARPTRDEQFTPSVDGNRGCRPRERWLGTVANGRWPNFDTRPSAAFTASGPSDRRPAVL